MMFYQGFGGSDRFYREKAGQGETSSGTRCPLTPTAVQLYESQPLAGKLSQSPARVEEQKHRFLGR
jgi:hypothetical protein